jgi:hypothetical protein
MRKCKIRVVSYNKKRQCISKPLPQGGEVPFGKQAMERGQNICYNTINQF